MVWSKHAWHFDELLKNEVDTFNVTHAKPVLTPINQEAGTDSGDGSNFGVEIGRISGSDKSFARTCAVRDHADFVASVGTSFHDGIDKNRDILFTNSLKAKVPVLSRSKRVIFTEGRMCVRVLSSTARWKPDVEAACSHL